MSKLRVDRTFRAPRVTMLVGAFLCTIMLFAPEAGAHPGHSGPHLDAGALPNGGRLPGQPDFERIGKTAYRFLPAREEYEIRREGHPPTFAHVDFAPAEGANAGPNTPLPTAEDAPICRTSGHRIVVVYTRRGGGGHTPTEEIRSIIRRMNWKLVSESSQSSGGARPLQMAVDCTGGAINVYTVETPNNNFSTMTAEVSAELFEEPFGDDSIKYLVFDSESNGTATGLGDRGVDPKKTFSNVNASQTMHAVVYKTVWETHVPMHELFHTLGASQGGPTEPAPFSSPGGHCYDGIDILCYEDFSGKVGLFSETRCPASEGYDQAAKTPIDCGTDTYFDAAPEAGSWLASHWNAGGEENPFLVNENDPRIEVITGGLVKIDKSEVTATGTVATNDSKEIKYRFEYGPTTAYGSSAPASFTTVAGTMQKTAVKQDLTGLTPGTEYHYRLTATNGATTVFGADRTFTATRWRMREVPSFEKSTNLYGVSCSGPMACTAVGVGAKQPEVTVALRSENGEWVHQPTPNPGGASISKLNGVSCPTSSSCLAVGYWKMASSPSTEAPLAERWNGSSWTLEAPPAPAGSSGRAELLGVSCATASHCMAVGRYKETSAAQHKVLADVWNGSQWSNVPAPTPSGSTFSELRSVTCTSASNCLAVGTSSIGGGSVLVERWDGTSWSIQSTPVATGTSTELNDVSCASASACMAVGMVKGKFLALAWDGTKWTETTPVEAEVPSRLFHTVSCVPSGACIAIGIKGAQIWNGVSWVAEAMVTIGELLPSFKDIACSGETCVGAGFFFDAGLKKAVPILEHRSLYYEPSVETGAASSIDLNKATLSATVNPGGPNAHYYFEYGQTTAYGSKAPSAPKEIAPGEANVEVSQSLEGLAPNTTYHYRIVAFSEGGVSKGEDRTFTTHDTMPIKSLSFGTSGSGDGQFSFSRGIAVEPDGEVWVADDNNNRVQKFSQWGQYLTKFGSSGTGNGQFDTPVDVALTASGDLWVTDAHNCRVQKFDSTGKYLDQFGSCGLGDGEFVEASGIAIGPNGHIFVSDSRYYKVEEFTPEGDFVRSIGNYGINNGEFESPSGVAVDANGHVWVSDDYLNRVQEFSPDGEYLSQFGTAGTGAGQFAGAGPIEVTPSGRIWVTDRETGRVQAFNLSGHHLGTFGSFWEPAGIAAGPEGSVYVSDSRNDRVQKWRPAKKPTVATLAAQGITPYEAKLRGTVDPEGFATDYHFEYGKTTAYGTSVPVPDQTVAVGDQSVEVSQAIGSLTPGTTYHYRISAKSDGGGPVFSADQTFETLPPPPTAVQLAAMATTKAFDGSSGSLADFGAHWSTLGWASGSTPKGADTSTGWRAVDAHPTANGAYFNPPVTDTGPGTAAAATLAARPASAGNHFSVWLDMPNPAAASRTGYELRFTETATDIYEVAISKWQSGTKTGLATKTGYSFPVGSRLALVDKGATVSAWTKTGSEFTELLSASDSAFGAGNAGLEAAGNVTRLTDFKTGSLLSSVTNVDAAINALALNDTLVRTESPLSAEGAWAALSWANGSSGKNTGQATSLGWTAADSYPTINGAYWTKAAMPDTGAGVGVTAKLGPRFPNLNRYFSLWLDMPSPGSARTGYELRATETAGNSYEVVLSKWQAGTQTVLASKTGQSIAGGNHFALIDKGSTVSAWIKAGSGEFTQLLSAEDSAFISGYTGIEINGNAHFLKDFKSGSLAPF